MTIKFMYNGIKHDGKLHKTYYFLSSGPSFPEGTITISAKGYGALPDIGIRVENGTDIMTDYFDHDRIRVTPDHPHYPQVLAAYNQYQARHGKNSYDPPAAVPVIVSPKAEKKSNVIALNLKESATPPQLWALHCITNMDTRDWVITKKEASALIRKANNGTNILQYVGQIERAAR